MSYRVRRVALGFVSRLASPGIAAGIWSLSSRSSIPLPKGIFGLDKLVHFVAYAVLAAATVLWIPPEVRRQRPIRSMVLAAGIAAAYGILDEAHQAFVPGRSASIYDWVADSIGAAAGAWGMVKLQLLGMKSRWVVGEVRTGSG